MQPDNLYSACTRLAASQYRKSSFYRLGLQTAGHTQIHVNFSQANAGYGDEKLRVLVTGATGFIGRRLVTELSHQGHEISIVTRHPSKAKAMFSDAIRTLDTTTLLKDSAPILADQDAVINLAGESIAGRWSPRKKKAIVDSRLAITNALAHGLRGLDHPPSTFISASAVGFYGDRNEETLTEKSLAGSGFLSSVCQQWEAAATAAHPKARVHCVRMGVVLGTGGGMLKQLLPLFKMGLGGSVGHGNQYLSWIHIDDAVRIFVHLLSQDPGHMVLNATGPEPVTMRTFAKSLGRAVGRPTVFTTPKFALNMVLGEGSDLALHSQRVLPSRLLEQGFHFRYSTIDQALSDLT